MASKLGKLESKLLLVWQDIEHWQRDNPSIYTGYRPQTNSYVDSFKSLFYWHNESINIYTHLLGSIVFVLFAPVLYRELRGRYPTVTKRDAVVFGCFFIGAIGCLGMSGLFHLIADHSHAVMKWGNQLDYLGIVLLIWGSFIPSIYYGFQTRPYLIGVYWGMISGIGLATGWSTISPSFATPEYRAIRASLFVAMGLSSVLPVLHGLWLFGVRQLDRQISLRWMVAQGGLYIAGAGLYAARIPEQYYPGRVDYVGASHQIFHVLVLAAAVTHLIGLIRAFDYWHSSLAGKKLD